MNTKKAKISIFSVDVYTACPTEVVNADGRMMIEPSYTEYVETIQSTSFSCEDGLLLINITLNHIFMTLRFSCMDWSADEYNFSADELRYIHKPTDTLFFLRIQQPEEMESRIC